MQVQAATPYPMASSRGKRKVFSYIPDNTAVAPMGLFRAAPLIVVAQLQAPGSKLQAAPRHLGTGLGSSITAGSKPHLLFLTQSHPPVPSQNDPPIQNIQWSDSALGWKKQKYFFPFWDFWSAPGMLAIIIDTFSGDQIHSWLLCLDASRPQTDLFK